jgi:hypothetical protein
MNWFYSHNSDIKPGKIMISYFDFENGLEKDKIKLNLIDF